MKIGLILAFSVCAFSQNRVTITPRQDRGDTGLLELLDAHSVPKKATISAPMSIPSDFRMRWFAADGTAGQCAVTDGAGNLSFGSCNVTDISPYDFPQQFPGGSLSAGTGQVITMTPCPLGLADRYYIFGGVGATATDEVVPVTSRTCTSGAATGTITVTTANAHSGSWRIKSASGGIMDAVSDGKLYLRIPEGVRNIRYGIHLPTTVSLIGTGARTLTTPGGTQLVCSAFSEPCIAVADNLGTAMLQGVGQHRDYQLVGYGSGTGLHIGGDPSNTWWPGTVGWAGSWITTNGIQVTNFGTALEVYRGNFVQFIDSLFYGTAIAFKLDENNNGEIQPLDFRSSLLISDAISVQMDSTAGYNLPIRFYSGGVGAPITGTAVNWQSFGTNYETLTSDLKIVDITATGGGHIFTATGGTMSAHIATSPLSSMLNFGGTGSHRVTLRDIDIAVTSGKTATTLVQFGGSGGSLAMDGMRIAPAGTLENLFLVSSTQEPAIQFSHARNVSNGPAIAAATAQSFVQVEGGLNIPLNFPVSQVLFIYGATVGGGITSVSGLRFRQSGTFYTENPQTFAAGLTIGKTITTIPNVPYTYFFDNHMWISGPEAATLDPTVNSLTITPTTASNGAIVVNSRSGTGDASLTFSILGGTARDFYVGASRGNDAFLIGDVAAGKYSVFHGGTGNWAMPGDLTLSRAAGTERVIEFDTAGVVRWRLGAGQNAESGSNAGSSFYISGYSDGGSFVSTPLSISRATGAIAASDLTAATLTSTGLFTASSTSTFIGSASFYAGGEVRNTSTFNVRSASTLNLNSGSVFYAATDPRLDRTTETSTRLLYYDVAGASNVAGSWQVGVGSDGASHSQYEWLYGGSGTPVAFMTRTGDLTAATLTSTGLFTASSTSTFAGAASFYAGGEVRNSSTLNIRSGSTLNLNSGSTLKWGKSGSVGDVLALDGSGNLELVAASGGGMPTSGGTFTGNVSMSGGTTLTMPTSSTLAIATGATVTVGGVSTASGSLSCSTGQAIKTLSFTSGMITGATCGTP